MLKPANSYVSDFVAELNPLSVLTVDDAMVPDTGAGDPGRRVPRGASLKAVLPHFRTSDAPVSVGDDAAIVGRITPGAVLALLAGGHR